MGKLATFYNPDFVMSRKKLEISWHFMHVPEAVSALNTICWQPIGQEHNMMGDYGKMKYRESHVSFLVESA
jgi:hypothetical protein